MKSKSKKQEELKIAGELLEKSEGALFVDISGIRTADLLNLRRELRRDGCRLRVVKSRLLSLAMKGRGVVFDSRVFKTPIATVFAANLERAAGVVFRFFKAREQGRKSDLKKIAGGYDFVRKLPLSANEVLTLGQLPPREAALEQLAAMIATPLRSLLYLLKEKT